MTDRERVVVKDANGVTSDHEIIVANRIPIEVDCGCWSHRAPWPAELIISLGGAAYVRCGTEGFYRVSDGIGPIRIKVKQESDKG
jgi:hypothetical protein